VDLLKEKLPWKNKIGKTLRKVVTSPEKNNLLRKREINFKENAKRKRAGGKAAETLKKHDAHSEEEGSGTKAMRTPYY